MHKSFLNGMDLPILPIAEECVHDACQTSGQQAADSGQQETRINHCPLSAARCPLHDCQWHNWAPDAAFEAEGGGDVEELIDPVCREALQVEELDEVAAAAPDDGLVHGQGIRPG